MIKKTKWLIKEASLRVKYMTSKDCIFCKIVNGEIKSKILTENERVIAINDVNPVAKVHVLIFPKKHIDSVLTIDVSDGDILVDMFDLAKNLVYKMNLEAFRITFNGGKFQHVGHLHMHLLAGSKIEWGRL